MDDTNNQNQQPWTEHAMQAFRERQAAKEESNSSWREEFNAALDAERAERPVSKLDQAVDSAIGDFADQVSNKGAGNIHEVAFQGVKKVERQAAEQAAFDTDKFEKTYGLPPGYAAGITREQANDCLATYFGDDVAESHQAAAHEAGLSDAMQQLSKRLHAHMDSFGGKYGTSSQACTPEQDYERRKLARAAGLHLAALRRSGGPVPKIESLLNWARLSSDPDWKPSFNKPKQYPNIHVAALSRS